MPRPSDETVPATNARTMQLRELRALLAEMPDDAGVWVEDAYGEGLDDRYYRSVIGVTTSDGGQWVILLLESRNAGEEK